MSAENVPIYNDETPMPFGKYEGVPLVDVPATHLLYLHTETKMRNESLKAYIEDNLDVLLLQAKTEEKRNKR